MLSMKEAIENYVEGCVGKVDCPAYKLFMKAILAGMMIAFGAAGSSVAAHDIANVGIARLVAGVVFPMGLGKCNLDFTTALASGILCNILVCAAVMLAARAKDVTGKLLCCFFIILLFVVSGYEHCVANMYYVPAGMIAKLNPLYVKDAMEQYGYTAQQLSTLNIPNFIFNNLIPVTIGNIVGGMAFFGIPLMYINGVGGKKA